MTRARLIIAAAALAVIGAGAGIAATAGTATAGIGPAGFARVAQRAIIAENCKIYGGCANSPWLVRCTDHPDYVVISDRVVCSITVKP